MVCETTNLANVSPLLPERHSQHDLFICDVADAVLKDVMQEMEHPFFSLSKKPDVAMRRYENNGQWLQVTPSVKGLATIYDKDILIYCISQLMAKLRKGEPVSKRVSINSRELLVFTNRGTSGKDYEALQEAIERIRGTTITTNIRTGSEEQTDTFGLIDSSSIRRHNGLDGRLLSCEITLSDWVFNAIRADEVLTLHRDYFRLRKPIERRIYEIARKHCGRQMRWEIGLPLLHNKCGSRSRLKEFKRLVSDLVKGDHLPDYHVGFDGDKVVFRNRGTMMEPEPASDLTVIPALKPSTYQAAREAAQGWDIYVLEAEWREWATEAPRDPDAAFIGFCRKVFEKRGRP
ncbi:replication initiator protein A [Novosphingobium terrae]|uniref:replication initiator protein A n=1 Tax=Novosphingobium terrae TaxID=2726189 RepID=UPI0019808E05|nr:replication initiator protein A [Novosphingobium terrae]